MTRPLAILLGLALCAAAAEEPASRKGGSRQPVQRSACIDVPPHPFDVLLGRPTSNSVTVSVRCDRNTEGWIEYGTNGAALSMKTPVQQIEAGRPVEMELGDLRADTPYAYRFSTTWTNSPVHRFHTARPTGSRFTFTITADSHLDEHSDCALYERTLAQALADRPDFHIDLGDTFMTEKHASREIAAKQYVAQRYYLGHLCASAPLFFVLGNHDGESPRGRGDAADELAVWANATRKRHFPNPVPDGFYSGNPTAHPQAGLLQDYYAWTWGDALFMVLDPFWFTQKQRGQRDGWRHTLGAEQYHWLERTLEGSRASFTFVFIHHLVGGADDQCRGGAEAVPYFEWGGHNRDGTPAFREHRPGWDLPIHELLLKNKVSIVFHGHDHLYARQEVDGIVYQEVPQPADPRGSTRSAAAYGYTNGVILGSSGHLRVAMAPDSARVDYLRADGSVAHGYAIPARGSSGR